jgi:hypothetical protein
MIEDKKEIDNMEYNVYCDESCHLQNDGNDIMVIGGVWVPKSKRKQICKDIIRIKESNGLPKDYELKWSKVSSAKKGVYIDLINKFFDDYSMNFRGVVVHDKGKLDFSRFSGTYNDWYYKIYYLSLQKLLKINTKLNIYLDIKDTHSSECIKELKKYIESKSKNIHDCTIENLHVIRSDEVEIMQITDILIGALSYVNRNLSTSKTKLELINLIKARSYSDLVNTTKWKYKKFNILSWRPQ